MTRTGLSRRERGILYFSVIFLLVALVYKIFYIPFQARLELMSQERMETQDKLQKDRKLIRKAGLQEKKYRVFLNGLKQIGTDEQIISAMVDEIETGANAKAIRVVDMKPQRVRRESGYNYFSVSVNLEGDMVALLALIHALQTSPSLFWVDEFQLERKAQGTHVLQCSLLLGRILIPTEEAPVK
jgi:Tfp pilus assembly protein PilO